MKLRGIHEAGNLRGARVLARMDFNVPVARGVVSNSFRIDKGLPVLRYLRERGARVIAISHRGEPEDTLEPVYAYLKSYLPRVSFCPALPPREEAYKAVRNLENGDVLLLENVRSRPGEEKNGQGFAEYLSSIADIYMNEAFSASHRAHASIVSIPMYLPGYAGPLFMEEVEHLRRVRKPARPLVVVLGGAKFATKLPVVKTFLPLAEKVFVYGALAHDLFVKQGREIGRSLADRDVDVSDLLGEEKIVLPEDVVAAGPDGRRRVIPIEEVRPDDTIWDAGPRSVEAIGEAAAHARTILWNGPLGNYEEGYREGTEALAKVIAENPAYSVVGGGDTIASIERLGLREKFGFVSTGGGAMLSFLASGTLAGIEALTRSGSQVPL